MGVTNRDLDRVREDRVVRVLERAVRKIAPALRWLARRMPKLRSRLERNTLGGRSGVICSLIQEKRFGDPTWPAGHIALAWYGLTTGKFDPLPRLREAIRLTADSLAVIRGNPEFARFPDLIAALAGPADNVR
jgi:hypothetical protein